MNPLLILLGLAVIAFLFVLLPVASAAFWRWRRPWRLTCPRTESVAQIRVAASRAAVAEAFGHRAAVERCSLWPVRGCRDECLALSTTEMRAVPSGTPPPRADADGALRTILVPLDGSAGSAAVLAAVHDLARRRGAVVRLLRVVAPVSTAMDDDDRVVAYADQETARVEDEARRYLRGAAAALPGVTVQIAVRFGEPVAGIVDEAEAAGADVIALATHRRLGLGRVVKSSVSRRLERATTIPLLLVPYGEPAVA